MQQQNFTNRSQETIQLGAQIASENQQAQVEPPHLFFAFLAGYTDAEGCIGIYQNKKKH